MPFPYGIALFHESLISREERRWSRMKKALSKEALVKEAAFWSDFRKAVKENPGKVCHK